jgi:hypothetical protein
MRPEKVEIEQLCSRIVDYEGEPRIRDLDLGERLGFADPRMIRKLIQRNLAELSQFGVIYTVEITSGIEGGRPGIEYWLNEKQVYAICQLSNAPKAAAVRRLMVEVFYAYQHKTDLASKRRLQIIIRQELQPIDERLVKIEEGQQKLEDGQEKILTEVIGMRKEQDDYHRSKRLDFTEEVKKAFAIVTRTEFGDLCCWYKNPQILLVTAAYEFTEDAEIDHYYRRDQRRFEDGFVLCLACHTKKDKDRPGARVAFDYFQQVGAKYKPKLKKRSEESDKGPTYQRKLPIKFFK